MDINYYYSDYQIYEFATKKRDRERDRERGEGEEGEGEVNN